MPAEGLLATLIETMPHFSSAEVVCVRTAGAPGLRESRN